MSGSGGRTNLASCVVATAFLILAAAIILAAVFLVYRPKQPTIAVSKFQIPSFSRQNSTVQFTFSQLAAVTNPNRAAFSHYDSTLQLTYAGNQVGFMFIPAGEIDGGKTQYVAASLTAGSFPLAAGPGSLLVESRMEMMGKVRVLRFLTHRVEAGAYCLVGVSAADGSILGARC